MQLSSAVLLIFAVLCAPTSAVLTAVPAAHMKIFKKSARRSTTETVPLPVPRNSVGVSRGDMEGSLMVLDHTLPVAESVPLLSVPSVPSSPPSLHQRDDKQVASLKSKVYDLTEELLQCHINQDHHQEDWWRWQQQQQQQLLENENGYLKVEVSDGTFSGTSLFHSLSLKLACLFIFIFH